MASPRSELDRISPPRSVAEHSPCKREWSGSIPEVGSGSWEHTTQVIDGYVAVVAHQSFTPSREVRVYDNEQALNEIIDQFHMALGNTDPPEPRVCETELDMARWFMRFSLACRASLPVS